jgi:hypothetical protein
MSYAAITSPFYLLLILYARNATIYAYANEFTQSRMPQRRLYSEVIPTETKNGVFAETFARG